MVTIKGFRGLSTTDLFQNGEGNTRTRIGINSPTSNIARTQLENAISSNFESTATLGAVAEESTSVLSVSDRATITQSTSIKSAAAALTSIVEKIQTLTAQYQVAGTNAQSAITGEINALSTEYNNVLRVSGGYTSADLSAFSNQLESMSSLSSVTGVALSTNSSSISLTDTTISTISALIAPTLTSLSDISSTSALNTVTVSSLSAGIDTASSGITSLTSEISSLSNTITALNTALTNADAASLSLQSDLDLVQSSLVPASLLSSSSLLSAALETAVSSQSGASAASAMAQSSYNNSYNDTSLSSGLLSTQSADIEQSAANRTADASLAYDAAHESDSTIMMYGYINDSLGSISGSIDVLNSQSSSYTSDLASLDSLYSYYSSVSGESDVTTMAVLDSIAATQNAINTINIDSSNAFFALADVSSSLDAVGYTAAVANSLANLALSSSYYSEATSYSSAADILGVSLNSVEVAMNALNAGVAAGAASVLSANNDVASISADYDVVVSSINSGDPVLLSSSSSLAASITAVNLSSATADSDLSVAQSASTDAEIAVAASVTAINDFSSSIVPLDSARSSLSNDIVTLSLSVSDSLVALDSLGSESEILIGRQTSLQNGQSSFSSEIVALAAASSTAAVEAASSSSVSLSELASDLRDVGVNQGITVDLSTRALSRVTSELLSNRLSGLSAATRQIDNTISGVEFSAEQEALQPGDVTLSKSEKTPTPKEATALAAALKNSIISSRDLALNAIGNLNPTTVSALLDISKASDD